MNKILILCIFALGGCWLIPQEEEDYLGDWRFIRSTQDDSPDYYHAFEGLLELKAGGDFSSNFSYFTTAIDNSSEEDVSGSWVVTIDQYRCTGSSVSSEMIELFWDDTSKIFFVEFFTDSTFSNETGGTPSSWWLWREGPASNCLDGHRHHYWEKVE